MRQLEVMNTAAAQNPYLFSWRKRTLDVALGSALAGLSYPVEAATVIGLRRSLDHGPMYLRQARLGTTVCKLRTMYEAPLKSAYKTVRESSDLHDLRVPPGFPEAARRLRLDELPQFRQAVWGGIRGGAPRNSLVGVRPLLEHHADEFYEEVRAVDPDLAYRWRYQWQAVAPRGAFSPAACHFMGRDSNADLDIVEWVRLEDAYCQSSNEITDMTLIGQSLVKLGATVGEKLFSLTTNLSSKDADQ